MPGGFNASSIKCYLAKTWGLQLDLHVLMVSSSSPQLSNLSSALHLKLRPRPGLTALFLFMLSDPESRWRPLVLQVLAEVEVEAL